LTRLKLFQKYFAPAYHNLICYSHKDSLDEPKEGCEKEWDEAGKEVIILRQLILEEDKKAGREMGSQASRG